MTSDLQSRLTGYRERLRTVEAAARNGATVLGDLEAAEDFIDRIGDSLARGEVDRARAILRDYRAAMAEAPMPRVALGRLLESYPAGDGSAP